MEPISKKLWISLVKSSYFVGGIWENTIKNQEYTINLEIIFSVKKKEEKTIKIKNNIFLEKNSST